MEVRCYLRDLMERRGLDQKSLAIATGLSPTTVNRLYKNRFDRIDAGTVVTLCKYFGLSSISQLIEVTELPEEVLR